MKYAYRVLDVAAAELLEAALWYDMKRSGLGDEFMQCFEAALNQVLKNPFAFQVRYNPCRFALYERFPYYLVFYVEEDLVTVLACFHAKRNPRSWKRRLKK